MATFKPQNSNVMKFSDDEEKHIFLLFGKLESRPKVRRQFLRDFRIFAYSHRRNAKQFKHQDFTKIKRKTLLPIKICVDFVKCPFCISICKVSKFRNFPFNKKRIVAFLFVTLISEHLVTLQLLCKHFT